MSRRRSRARPRLQQPLVAVLVLAALVAACSPSLSVSNGTSFQVRAIVTGEGGSRNVHLVRAGQSSAGDVPEGAYSVTIVPDGPWVEAARAARDALVSRLQNPDELGPAGVADVLREIDGLSATLRALEAAADGPARCLGSIPIDGVGTADITVGDDGRLRVSCSGTPMGTPQP